MCIRDSPQRIPQGASKGSRGCIVQGLIIPCGNGWVTQAEPFVTKRKTFIPKTWQATLATEMVYCIVNKHTTAIQTDREELSASPTGNISLLSCLTPHWMLKYFFHIKVMLCWDLSTCNSLPCIRINKVNLKQQLKFSFWVSCDLMVIKFLIMVSSAPSQASAIW